MVFDITLFQQREDRIMEEGLLNLLSSFGGYAVIAGVLLWQNTRTTDKMTEIIETNTRAMTEMKNVISKMIDRLERLNG